MSQKPIYLSRIHLFNNHIELVKTRLKSFQIIILHYVIETKIFIFAVIPQILLIFF